MNAPRASSTGSWTGSECACCTLLLLYESGAVEGAGTRSPRAPPQAAPHAHVLYLSLSVRRRADHACVCAGVCALRLPLPLKAARSTGEGSV